MKSLSILCLGLGAATGCASSPPMRFVRVSEVGRAPVRLAPGEVLVLEFQPGDEVPLSVRVEGPLVEGASGSAPVRLRARRRFFLRVGRDGVATSLDGRTFGAHAAPGTFRFGVLVTQQDGVTGEVVVRTPTPREP